MGKGHLPIVAKVQNQMLGEVAILGARFDSDPAHTFGNVEHYVAEVYCGGPPVPVTHAMLVSLRDQLSIWLQANPTE